VTSVIAISTLTHKETAEVGAISERAGESGSKVSFNSAGITVWNG
jgi:hypothetical protein